LYQWLAGIFNGFSATILSIVCYLYP